MQVYCNRASVLAELVESANYFLRSHAEILRHNLIEIYVSPLLFSSTGTTLITQYFKEERPNWVVMRSLSMREDPNRVDIYSKIPKLALSADGRTLATFTGGMTFTVWDIETTKVVSTWTSPLLPSSKSPIPARIIALSHDGKLLAIKYSRLQFVVRDVVANRTLHIVTCPATISLMAFSADSQTLRVAWAGSGTRLWDSDSGNWAEAESTRNNNDEVKRTQLEAKTLPSSDYVYTVNSLECQVEKNGQKLLRIPPDYCPWVSAVAGSTVAIASPSGLFALKFAEEG